MALKIGTIKACFTIKVYLESYPSQDPNCEEFCGKHLPYISYSGIPFCMEDATDASKWIIVDFSAGGRVKDPTMKVTCS